ncbi:phospho-sugar mutase [Arcanobacterium bovis]|uniref:Phospho-sugar mutase n=1 Tax=Arcanobacterium bovis TaxID=2529275 RepID=A0A4V2KR51_9ACTO|nr:phospho-sugar mutase [Arcanobacterium bovis]TBW22142.1 phospho-sugar mutase [Arcanobacterium bovis]
MNYSSEQVREWINHDPEEETREELTAILAAAEAGDQAAAADLADRFQGTLQFGTAGLRGAMGGGPFRMNRAVVRRAAAGLTAWLRTRVGDDAVVVIGYDARYHSADFARDTAAIVTAAGARAILMPRNLPTPVLAFAVRYLGADAGVMVTASHNPPQDNGYKVYLGGRAIDASGNGVQIVPPVDAEIAAQIDAAPHADEIPLAESGWDTVPETVIDAYVDSVSQMAGPGSRDVKIVYTAMHGVGTETMMKVFAKAGFTQVVGVPEQIEPDPAFPTVAFPNPEEPGALDLAIALAKAENADIVIASDPDADRCSAAIPTGDGEWRQLSGDEIGSLLGECVAIGAERDGVQGNLASSIVSSRLLEKIAHSHGLGYQATLTGFKWIARAPEIIFGYEEAIGFCVKPQAVKDKDGISAAVLLAWLAAHLRENGTDLQGDLDRIAIREGLYLSGPVTIRVEDLSIIPATMAKVREFPPTELVGSPVTSIVDLSRGTDSLPPTDAVMIHTQANDRVIIRPSGTEPKVKCYLEVIEPVADEAALPAAKERAAARLAQFKLDMAQVLKLD